MADTDDKASGSLTVESALKMYDAYKSYWADNYREAAIDLKMYMGDPGAHWGDGWDPQYKAPAGPMVVSNELPQYVHQVCNDIRQNVPSLKAFPVADGDIETGKVIAGLFRGIEYYSHADEVTDTGAEYAVTCSIGFMRVDHDYCDEEPDVQEILFKTVPDPLSVYIDPASVEYDGRDANGAICLEPINKEDFERLYPNKAFASFTDPKGQKDTDREEKVESIILAEIFIREKSGKDVVVHRYKVSGQDILNHTTFQTRYIPIVPIYGEVRWVNGKRILSSLIRQARSPQRRLNHMLSKESLVLAMAPIAPILAARGQIVNDRKQYQNPGSETVLEYETKDVDGNTVGPPIRLQPPGASPGFLEAIASAKEAIKASMGIYSAGLGKREGDASGIALKQLDHSGDVATFHYPDNVRRSYTHMGEIAVDMMPVIYDTPRIIQTLNDEQDVSLVGINGAPMQEGQTQPFDLTKGKYRVRVSTGASYTTKRQEEAAFLAQIAQKDPNFMQIGGDILFKSMDTPGAQALSERYKKLIRPELLEDNNQDPRIPQLMQALQQAQGQIQQLDAELQNKNADIQLQGAKLQVESKKLDVESMKVQGETFKAKAEILQAMLPKQEEQAKGLPIHPDMSEDEILSVLDRKRQESANQQLAEQQQQQIEAEDKQRHEAMEMEELRLKGLDIATRQEQATALINSLSGITAQLHALMESVNKPKQVIRDPQTNAIVGVH